MKRLYLGFFGVFIVLASAQADIQLRLHDIFQQSNVSAEWSVLVQEKDSGKEVFSISPKRHLLPASNMKVIVGAAALLALGPDFRYETPLYHTGNIHNGALQGALIVSGSGDPSIGGRFNDGDIAALFHKWADVLKEQGVKTVTGNILGYDNAFDDVPHGLNWDPVDFVKWYAAEVSALNLNDGCVDITVLAAKQSGKAPRIRLEPSTDYINLVNRLSTVANSERSLGVMAERPTNSNRIKLKGNIQAGHARKMYVPVHNPTHYFVQVFKETLQRQEIAVQGAALDADHYNDLPDESEWKLVDTHYSPPFQELLAVCLKRSQNLYAEQFLKTLGAVRYGTGSYETGVMAVNNILFEHGYRLDDQVYIADGSGLSRDNRLSAETLVRVLEVMAESRYAELFKESLAEAGVDGTLKRRMRHESTREQIYAKTGTLKGVAALSGYLTAASGQEYIFSMMANSENQYYSFHSVIDKACELIAEHG